MYRWQNLIDEERWDEVYAWYEKKPKYAFRMVGRGCSVLHYLCSKPSVPCPVLELVASLNPSAIVQTGSLRNSPLHVICRHSTTTVAKVQALVKFCPKVDDNDGPSSSHSNILGRNYLGETALHIACRNNASIEILQTLVEANPSILTIRAIGGVHVVSSLWSSYAETKAGSMQITKILQLNPYMKQPMDSMLLEVWNKLEYLATEYYFSRLPISCSLNTLNTEARKNYVLFGLIRCDAPIQLLEVALKMNPYCARALDDCNNQPIHILLEKRPYQSTTKHAIVALLQVAPENASWRNRRGEVPMTIGIRKKVPWKNGLSAIVAARTTVVGHRHRETGLYPFLYAATQGEECVTIETTYQLLLMRPDLLN